MAVGNATIAQMTKTSLRKAAFAACAALLSAISADAQLWPDKPTTQVVPLVPGGSTDGVGCTIGEKVGDCLKQPVAADRPGAGRTVAIAGVVKAPAYTPTESRVSFEGRL